MEIKNKSLLTQVKESYEAYLRSLAENITVDLKKLIQQIKLLENLEHLFSKNDMGPKDLEQVITDIEAKPPSIHAHIKDQTGTNVINDETIETFIDILNSFENKLIPVDNFKPIEVLKTGYQSQNERQYNPCILLQLGLFYYKNKNWKQAIYYYQKALETNLFPNLLKIDVLCCLASSYDAIGNIDTSFDLMLDARDLTKVIGTNNFQSLKDLGYIQYINTFLAKAAISLGIRFLQGGDYLEAISYFNDAQHLQAYLNKEQCLLLYLNKGLVSYQVQDYSNATSSFTHVLKSENRKEERRTAYYYRGLCYFQNSTFMPAILDFKQCIELTPNSVLPYYFCALSFNFLENNEEAFYFATMAKKLAPDNPDINNIYKKLEQKLGLNNTTNDNNPKSNNQNINLEKIPKNVLFTLFSFLNTEDKKKMALVSKKMHEVANLYYPKTPK